MLDGPRISEEARGFSCDFWGKSKRIQDHRLGARRKSDFELKSGKFVPVADTSQLTSGVAERYASSLFELALEEGAVDSVTADLDRFQVMLDESEDLKRFVLSPVFSAEDQLKAIVALSEKAGISGFFANFLKVVARNRRLFALPGMIKAFRIIAANQRGEISAEVTSAHALSAEQENELKAALKGVTGKDVAIAVTVDPSILGGLIVKVGSRQIDTSLRS
jgi:F-type H+-transporting ATPase subunit delta